MPKLHVIYFFCCCRHDLKENVEENRAEERIMLRTKTPSMPAPGWDQRIVTEEKSLWNSDQMPDTDSDGELHAFIRMRNRVDKDTEEWEKLNYDIHTLKCARRQVATRWKKILLKLGYQGEADSLLTVCRTDTLGDAGNLSKAKQLLHRLCAESALFPRGCRGQDRYLFVMDRLVSLDSAEDFVRLAKEKYPKD